MPIHSDGKDYVVVSDVAFQEVVDIQPVYGVQPVPTRAYFVARYIFDKNHINIHSRCSSRLRSLE